MTCAKAVVIARLSLLDGRSFIGRNDCETPVQVCPRVPGDGYEKCREICGMRFHAEARAVMAAFSAGAGQDLAGATMEVAHNHICGGCAELLRLYGITARLVDGIG